MSTNINVRDERQFNLCAFDEVECGSWFLDEDENLYCKTSDDEGECALRATTGDLEEFAPDEFVRPIKKLTFVLEE